MAHQYSTRFERVTRFIARHAGWVIVAWILVAAAVTVAFPPLEQVEAKHGASPLPTDLPAIESMTKMAELFHQGHIDNTVMIVMTDPNGFTTRDRALYSALAERLRADTNSVAYVQDPLSDVAMSHNPLLRGQVISADGKAWLMMAGLNGRLGDPDTLTALVKVRSIVSQTVAGSPTTAMVTGPPATIADLAGKAIADFFVIAAISFALITIILLMVYRSLFTAMLPMLVVGMAITVARGILAGLGEHGFPLASTTAALTVAVMSGACVNYAVFFISRYHENIRAGNEMTDALARSGGSMIRVILATALTVALANLAQLAARLSSLAAAGPAVAVGIAVGFLSAITMLPAVLAIASRWRVGLPKNDRTRKFWHRTGVLAARRPVAMLAISIAVLAVLISQLSVMKLSYDDRAAQGDSTESSKGYATLTNHFPAENTIPQYLLIQSDRDLRTPRALADLDQMAARIAQLPGVSKVVGITRPTGEKLAQATLAWQVGALGKGLDAVNDQWHKGQPALEKVQKAADLISQFNSEAMKQVRGDVEQLLDDAKKASGEYEAYSELIDRLVNAGAAVDQLQRTAPDLAKFNTALDRLARVSGWLNRSNICPVSEHCRELRDNANAVLELRDSGVLDSLREVYESLDQAGDGRPASVVLADLKQQMGKAGRYLAQLPQMEAQYRQFTNVVAQLEELGFDPELGARFGAKLRELTSQAQQEVSAINQLAAFLQTVGTDASSSAASGFYLPPAILDNSSLSSAAGNFISPDGKAARYLIQSEVAAFGSEAMNLSSRISAAATAATPNTSLAAAKVSVGGYPAITADLQHFFQRDFRDVIIVTLLIIFVVTCVLLRAIVAPLYLLATVVLTYLAALGAGVFVFQVLLGQELYWVIPALTFVLVVAVGADYNMLLISRLREESARSAGTTTKVAVIRTVAYTGSVITSAGMIFAASMAGMMASSAATMLQMGFIIGFGILLDTFVVRTLAVPAIAVLLGKASWWPSRA